MSISGQRMGDGETGIVQGTWQQIQGYVVV